MRGRNLYLRVVDPECWLPDDPTVDDLRVALRGSGRTPPKPLHSLAAGQRAATEWSSAEAVRFRELVATAGTGETRQLMVRAAAISCAPLAVLSGAWLHGLTSPGNADDPLALRILAMYAGDIGVGRPHASRGSEYRNLLRRLRLSEFAGPAANLPLLRIPDEAFALPALLMAMSRRPEGFHAELVGADLCLRSVGLLPALTVIRDELPDAVDWAALDPGSTLEHGRSVAETVASSAGQRVLLGFAWALDEVRDWSAWLRQRLDAVREPAHTMAELLRRRAREGAAYHRNFTLAGRTLSEWLHDARHDPEPLLRVLRESPLVRPGNADKSALVNGMIGPHGPMFRIFSVEDVVVIRRWIDSLADRAHEPPVRADQVEPPAEVGVTVPIGGPPETGRHRTDLRLAYHALQGRAPSAAMRWYALDYVRRWLDRARRGVRADGTLLPATWPADGLRPWLLDQHDKHARQFEAGSTEGTGSTDSTASAQSREELVDSSVQLAPLTLIDGAWLLGFTDYELAATDVGYRLFDTYWDELGNGDPALNHPRIYRELLASMGVELAPTASLEFARWPGFRTESFELPVYWLSIGRFPKTFMPEVLGLNLAMELSGVGGSYRRAHVALKAHGFSTRFVDIHNTIDNVATGHSAWAADAIDSFMTAGLSTLGNRARRDVWDRVLVGFRSLNPPRGTWARWTRRLTGPSSGF